MTEVMNSSLDLLTRQMAGKGKSAEKTVDEFSGFKSMLKNRKQKKDDESTGNDTETAAADTAAAETAASMLGTGTFKAQNSEDMSRMNGQQMVQGLAEIGMKPAGIQAAQTDESGQLQMMNQLQTLNQLRFQQLAGKTEGSYQSEKENPALAQIMEEIPETGLLDEQNVPVTGEQKKSAASIFGNQGILKQNLTGDTEQEDENRIAADPLLTSDAETVQSTAEETPLLKVQGERIGKQKDLTEEENAKLSESLGVFQEKSYESGETQKIHTDNDSVTYTTVNAENLNELEAKLSEQIMMQIDSGKKELDVQLEPQNLGKIRIKVSYEDNQVSVSVLCTESKTLKLLTQSAGDLGTILESNLERPVQVIVDSRESDYLNNQQEQGGRQQQHQHQQEQGSKQEENREDFIQRLRLGIFETDSTDNGDPDYT